MYHFQAEPPSVGHYSDPQETGEETLSTSRARWSVFPHLNYLTPSRKNKLVMTKVVSGRRPRSFMRREK